MFRVSDDVFQAFPSYVVELVEVRLQAKPSTSARLDKLCTDAVRRLRALQADQDPKELEPIRVWREAFSASGWSPSRYPASVEALVKRVARSGEMPRILPLVDLANLTALTYLVPVGTHDVISLSQIPLEVRRATPTDVFEPIGSDQTLETPETGEIVYACANDIRTRRWVWRQSRTALIRQESTHVLFPIDGFADTTNRRIEAAADFLKSAAGELFDAESRVHRVERSKPEAHLQLS